MLVVTTAVAASIGSPATPGVGMVILAMVVSSVGIPASGVVLLLGVDRILDMSRTVINVMGDLTTCILLERFGVSTAPAPTPDPARLSYRCPPVRLGSDHLWIVLVVAAVGYFASGLLGRWLQRRKDLAAIADNWGQPLRSSRRYRNPDGWEASLPEAPGRVDDQTWADLELDRVYAWADRTLTALGAQMLYAWLRRPKQVVAKDRLDLARALGGEDRTALQRVLASVGDREGWDAARVLHEPGPELVGPRWMYTVLAVSLIPLIAAGVMTANVFVLGAGMMVALANPALHYVAARQTAGHLEGLQAIRRGVSAAPGPARGDVRADAARGARDVPAARRRPRCGRQGDPGQDGGGGHLGPDRGGDDARLDDGVRSRVPAVAGAGVPRLGPGDRQAS